MPKFIRLNEQKNALLSCILHGSLFILDWISSIKCRYQTFISFLLFIYSWRFFCKHLYIISVWKHCSQNILNENMYSVSNNDKCNNPYSRSSLVCMFKDNVCDMNVCAGCCILCMCVRKHFYNNLHHHIMIPKSCFCHMNEHQDSIAIMLYNNNGVHVYLLFLLLEMFFFKIFFRFTT